MDFSINVFCCYSHSVCIALIDHEVQRRSQLNCRLFRLEPGRSLSAVRRPHCVLPRALAGPRQGERLPSPPSPRWRSPQSSTAAVRPRSRRDRRRPSSVRTPPAADQHHRRPTARSRRSCRVAPALAGSPPRPLLGPGAARPTGDAAQRSTTPPRGGRAAREGGQPGRAGSARRAAAPGLGTATEPCPCAPPAERPLQAPTRHRRNARRGPGRADDAPLQPVSPAALTNSTDPPTPVRPFPSRCFPSRRSRPAARPVPVPPARPLHAGPLHPSRRTIHTPQLPASRTAGAPPAAGGQSQLAQSHDLPTREEAPDRVPSS